MWANEIDPYCADWLRNLFPGITVDERSIVDLRGSDVIGDRAHFFAGIGGWEYALRLAGWPEDRPVWTGSCPCQPLSSAGRRKGHADERHLWPAFYSLIAECRPPTIFGEQVASNLGREWLAGVRADLEGLGYAVGAADLCAAGVGAPHIRQRLLWMADADGERRTRERVLLRAETTGRNAGDLSETTRSGAASGMVHTNGDGHHQLDDEVARNGSGDSPNGQAGRSGAWSDAVWIPCLDGKARRIKPGLIPLASGVPARASKLRAYGNAIVPQVAAVFVKAFLDTEGGNNGQA